MAYIFSTGAVLRLISARPDDPLVQWIEGERIRPLIVAPTMASVLDEIRTSPNGSPLERPVFERRYRRLVIDLDADRRERVTSAVFDLNAAEILADLMPLPAGQETLSDMDLIPAAIAIQHNLELVVCDHHASWHDLSQALAPEIGRLELKIFPLLPD